MIFVNLDLEAEAFEVAFDGLINEIDASGMSTGDNQRGVLHTERENGVIYFQSLVRDALHSSVGSRAKPRQREDL